MEKAERRVNSPIAGPAVQKLYSWFGRMTKLMMQHLYSLFFYKGLIYMVIGFLLGRAFILSEVIPFALPFFGAMLLIKKDKAFLACLALLAGALSISPQHSLFVLAALVCICDMFKNDVPYYKRPCQNAACRRLFGDGCDKMRIRIRRIRNGFRLSLYYGFR